MDTSQKGKVVPPPKPDYEKQLTEEREELRIVNDFRESLLRFIRLMGVFSFEDDRTFATLLGSVDINVMEREEIIQDIENTMKEEVK